MRIERLAEQDKICKRWKNSHCFAVTCRFPHTRIVETIPEQFLIHFQIHAGKSLLQSYDKAEMTINCIAHKLTPLLEIMKFVRLHFVCISHMTDIFIHIHHSAGRNKYDIGRDCVPSQSPDGVFSRMQNCWLTVGSIA